MFLTSFGASGKFVSVCSILLSLSRKRIFLHGYSSMHTHTFYAFICHLTLAGLHLLNGRDFCMMPRSLRRGWKVSFSLSHSLSLTHAPSNFYCQVSLPTLARSVCSCEVPLAPIYEEGQSCWVDDSGTNSTRASACGHKSYYLICFFRWESISILSCENIRMVLYK